MRITLAVAVACLTIGGIAAADNASAAIRKTTNIPVEGLGPALTTLAKEFDFQVLYRTEVVGTLRTQGAVGEFTPDEALKQLLSGTGLTYRYLDDKTVTIMPVGPTSLSPSSGGGHDAAQNEEAEKGNQSQGGARKKSFWDHFRLAQATPSSNSGLSPQSSVLSTKLAQANTVPTRPEVKQQQEQPKLEEIIVTAMRRETKLQETPVAITALSQEDLQRNNINSLGDLQNFVPSLNAQGYGRNNMTLTLRGQGVNNLTGLPAVVTYLNEVPIPVDTAGQSLAGPGLYYDLDNVQVLKGPQGTLFGRNTTGGAILFQPKRPTNNFEGRLQLTGGNHSDQELDGALNLPVVPDKLLVRVAVNGQKRDGYTKSLGDPAHPNGRDLDNSRYFAERVSVTFRPVDRVQNDLMFSQFNYTSHGQSQILNNFNPTGFVANEAGLFAEQQALGTRTQIPVDIVSRNDDKLTSVADILRVKLTEHLTFRNIVGYMNLVRNLADDRDGTINPVADLKSSSDHEKQYTEEAQLQGESWEGKLAWVTGAFFLDHPAQDFDFVIFPFFGTPFITGARNRVASKAGYAQGTYDMSSWIEGLKLTTGLRYTWDDKTSYSTTDLACASAACSVSLYGKSKALTWNVSLDYQVTSDTLLYLASRRGYRPGGANANYKGLSNPFGPEYVINEEVGVKSDWKLVGMPVRTDVAVYHDDYKDAQVNQNVGVDQFGFPITEIRNAAGARTWGAEFEGFINPTRALRLGAIFSWVNYKITNVQSGVNAASLIQYERLGRPPYTYGLNARYDLPVSVTLGEASLSANWSWQDRSGIPAKYVGPGGEWPAYGLLTLGASWDRIAGGPIDASFFMTNALNKTYVTNAIPLYSALGYSLASYGEPRMYGLRLRYNFK